jgi:hypothetical protein
MRMPACAPTSRSPGPPVRITRSVAIVPLAVSTPVTTPRLERLRPVNASRSRTSTFARCIASEYARTLRGGSMQPSVAAYEPPRCPVSASVGLTFTASSAESHDTSSPALRCISTRSRPARSSSFDTARIR